LLFQIIQFQHPGKGLDMGHIDCAPGVFLGVAFGRIMAFRLQCGGVRIRRFDNPADAGNPRLGAAGVVEEELVPTAMARRKLRA
jgi:hypothetical protein